METWLTYLAALLMAGATAFTFPSSSALLAVMNTLTQYLTNIGIFIFIPISFITLMSGTASLRKDSCGKKVLKTNILWALITSVVLAILALLYSALSSSTLPVTASAGGNYVDLLENYSYSIDSLGVSSLMNRLFLPGIVTALIMGIALTPSADIIRPAYTTINSFSEVMYRIQRTVSYFGCLYVYVAGTYFFLNLWQEKTAFVSPSFFISLLGATVVLVLVILPLLYSIFTSFKKNPYSLIGKSLSSLFFGFVSGNIYITGLQNEAIDRCNLGVQKRIVSTTVPFGIIITRGGTCFVSTVTVLSILRALNANVTFFASVVIAITVIILSLLSFMCAGFETAMISVMLFRVLNINVFGAEAAIIAIIPFLNGIATLIDITLITMATNIVAVKTKTDVIIPARDTI